MIIASVSQQYQYNADQWLLNDIMATLLKVPYSKKTKLKANIRGVYFKRDTRHDLTSEKKVRFPRLQQNFQPLRSSRRGYELRQMNS